MRRSLIPVLAVTATLSLLTACIRPVAVESDPGPRYTLEVRNPMPHPMIASYDDGSGERLLGTIPARGDERFVIPRPDRPTITVRATDEDRTHSVTREARLREGQVTVVSLES